MVGSRFIKDLPLLAALTAVYFLAGKFGLKLAFVNASSSAVWPCTGIALAAFLILGYRVWPAILTGAFLVNVTTAGSVLTSLGISTGNTLEGVAGCYLVCRFASGQRVFERAQDIFRFAFFAGMLSTTISATVGVTTLALGGFADSARYGAIWTTWWLGDAVGAVLVTPLVLLWWENPRVNWSRKKIVELVVLFLGLFSTCWVVFGNRFHSAVKNYPFEYLCIPFLVWAAFRFGRRKAATAVCALAVSATWGTLHGFGPFARESVNTSLLLLQTFMGIMAVTSLVLAAEVTEHKRAEEHAQQLATSDALTGLANYRRLLDALDQEIKRYGRTGKSFAVLLLDLDGLKKVNDALGHTVGNRALCRLANILQMHSREIDTAARYGGDEFVVVLTETESESAQHVAERVAEQLRSDGEKPPLTVSVGTAVYPRDGRTIEELLHTADSDLYEKKRLSKKRFRLPT
jgi:diguanylate cyclase (GGDEF)-like protein